MTGRKALWISIVLILLATCPVLNAQTDAFPSLNQWGPPVGNLQISLYLASDKIDRLGIPDVRLAIRNVGPSHQILTLGGGCGGPIPGSDTENVRLVLTDETGRSQELEDVPGPPLLAGCAGAVWLFNVDLPSGALYILPIDLDCYYVKHTAGHYGWAGGGNYSVRAEFEFRLPALDPLSGRTIQSNELDLHFAGNVAPVRCFSSGAEVSCQK